MEPLYKYSITQIPPKIKKIINLKIESVYGVKGPNPPPINNNCIRPPIGSSIRPSFPEKHYSRMSLRVHLTPSIKIAKGPRGCQILDAATYTSQCYIFYCDINVSLPPCNYRANAVYCKIYATSPQWDIHVAPIED